MPSHNVTLIYLYLSSNIPCSCKHINICMFIPSTKTTSQISHEWLSCLLFRQSESNTRQHLITLVCRRKVEIIHTQNKENVKLLARDIVSRRKKVAFSILILNLVRFCTLWQIHTQTTTVTWKRSHFRERLNQAHRDSLLPSAHPQFAKVRDH